MSAGVRRRLAALLVLLATIVLAGSGCAARLGLDVEIDRDGVGRVDLSMALDGDSQLELGFQGGAVAEDRIRVLFPFLGTEPGWSGAPFGAEGQTFAVQRDDLGGLVVRSRHAVTSLQDLRTLLTTKRDLSKLPSLALATDVPTSVPALNALQLTLGEGTGDNPGFNLFARGGVGELDQVTCRGDELLRRGGTDARLRGAAEAGGGLQFEYRFTLPGGPGSTNANDIEGSRTALWQVRYGDCPTLEASSGGGSSSTLINGVILAGASGFILIVLGLRALKKRRIARGA